MKKLLVPIDFSPTANSAIEFAVKTAKIFPAEVTLLHSYEVNSGFSADYYAGNREFNLMMLSDIEKRLDKAREKIKDLYDERVETFISTYSLNDSINKAVEEKHIDMIVMGTLGASGIKEKLWGSHTSGLIGKTETPVLVVPHDYEWKKPRKVLFATKRFEKDPGIINFIFELSGLYMANVQVAVFTDEDDEKAGTYIDNSKKIEEYEAYLKDNCHENNLTSVHLTGENFKETVEQYIKEHDIDLLVMVTYNTGFLDRLFNRSMTEKMSFQTKIPLLVLRGK